MKPTNKQIEDYRREEETLRQQIQRLKARSRAFVIGDILSFLGILFFLVLRFVLKETPGGDAL